MWILLAAAAAFAVWLLMMVAVWSALNVDGGLVGHPTGANHQ